MINIGFDCHVVCKKESIGKKAWVPRKLAYIFALVLTLIKKPGVSLSISHDGNAAEDKKLLLTTFANGAYCGGGFHSNPTASLLDGLIDCLAVKNVGRIKFLSLVGDYKAGRHLGEKFKNIIAHCKSSKLDMVFDRETPVSVDGEVVYAKELHLSVAHKAINIFLPRGVAYGMPTETASEVFAQ
jgi:diacylglycerol kinase family enzyme